MVGMVIGSHSVLLIDHFKLLLSLPDSGYLKQIFRFLGRSSIKGQGCSPVGPTLISHEGRPGFNL